MRDFLIFAVIFGLLPFCVARPYIGVLLWSLVGYMNPHRLTWGEAYDYPFAQLIAAATLLGFFITIIREGKFPKLPWERETILVLLLWAMFFFTTLFALRPDLAWPELEKISKILFMTLLTIMLINDERKYKYLLFVIALSIGFYGFKGSIFTYLTGGQFMVLGPEGSFLGDNTALGLALNMILPFLFFLAKDTHNRWLKRFLQLTFFLCVVSVMFTYSRGAFLGLVVVLGLIFLRLNFKSKIVIAVVISLLASIVLSNIPDKWFDRMTSIKTYKQVGSATARLEAWETAWKVALARPLTGGGFQIIDDTELSQNFNPTATERSVGVHSIYFEVLSENGFITLGIFLVLLASSIISTRKVRKVCQANGLTSFSNYSHMLEISIYAYAVSGAFLEFASFDLFYHLVALVIVLKLLSRDALQRAQNPTNGAEEKTPVWQSPFGFRGQRNLEI